MLGDVRAQKYSKTGARTRSILEKFALDTTLIPNPHYPTHITHIAHCPTQHTPMKVSPFVHSIL